MRKLSLLLAAVLMASAGSASAQAFLTTVGSAAQDGAVQFQLVAPDSSSLSLNVNVSAGDSSSVIASKIKSAVGMNGSFWQAQLYGSSVAFMHYTGSTWSWIGVILGLRDSSYSSLSVTARCPSWFSLSIDASAVASGTGPAGGKWGPSFLTFSFGGAAPYTTTPHPGQTAKSLMDSLCTYLGTVGISYTRESDTKIKIAFPTSTGASFQTNDSGLQGAVAVADAWDVQSGLIDR
jgi:hypothetical protein